MSAPDLNPGDGFLLHWVNNHRVMDWMRE